MSDFLPEGYEAPKQSQYMKLEDGENRIRILGTYSEGTLAIGWEYWIHDPETGKDKPIRRPHKDDELKEKAVVNKYGNKNINHFWAFPVYNYKAKEIQWLSITQVSIQSGIEQLVNDPDWGKPAGYDIKIIRETGDRTTYSVQPAPHKPLDKDILDQYKSMVVDKETWMSGGDPFITKSPAINQQPVSNDEIDLDSIPL